MTTLTIGKTAKEKEFGDFQTPPQLASRITSLLCRIGVKANSIIEPTCGLGNLFLAALDYCPEVQQAVGLEISQPYVTYLKGRLANSANGGTAQIIQADFFDTDLEKILKSLAEPILAIGNPPWVTNSQLSGLGSDNLPIKNNFQNHQGLDALMGKSNFDISEWMLNKLTDSMNGHRATMAMLCKNAVARKVLSHARKIRAGVSSSSMYHIDAKKYFDANVDACLFVCRFSPNGQNYDCDIFNDLDSVEPERTIGYRDDFLVSRTSDYDQCKHLGGQEFYQWRSGIKHDCSKVMELTRQGSGFMNGLGEYVELEDTCIYPMMKTSEVANAAFSSPNRFMIVTQKAVGEETNYIRERAPLTWSYLVAHEHLLDMRGSSIYKKRPRFSIFGVGPYTFAPWRVAISGFYKTLKFKAIGSADGKPIVLDDGTYLVACQTQSEAELLENLLNSCPAQSFLKSLIFLDTKRPVTIDHLRRLNIFSVAREVGLESQLREFFPVSHAQQTLELSVG